MDITTQDITEFQLLYKNRFGIDIEQQSAYKQLVKITLLMKSVYQPITEDDVKRLQDEYVNERVAEHGPNRQC
jgi:hypothetical protein